MIIPITALFAGLLILWSVFVSIHVSLARARKNVSLGDGGGDSSLLKILRVHGNTAEYTALFLIMMALLEFHGLRAEVLYVLGSVFVVGRVLHRRSLLRDSLKLRLWGMQFTLLPLGIGGCILVFTWFVQTGLF